MRNILLVSLLISISCCAIAQDTSIAITKLKYYINTDLVYNVVSIPMIGYERFYYSKKKLRSWRVDVAYQMHYNQQFGMVYAHGDKVSIGVYEGPAIRLGYDIYYKKHRKNWLNYCSYGVGAKYLWYNREKVNTAKRQPDNSYRIQSEQCPVIVPQLAIGAKRINKHFCSDFYVGLQLPLKFRNKTIFEESDNRGRLNTNVPYTNTQFTVAIAPVLGIKIGYIK
jgi:hypothetical protein